MERSNKKFFYIGTGTILSFVLWTVLVCLVGVDRIGPLESEVGFATINNAFHDFTGVHWFLYMLTDWLSIIPLAFVIGFAILGLYQWIKRKSLFKVDYDLLVLGAFYIATMAVYLFFEIVTINYRPILIAGILESSYPSSTTMLVLCVMISVIMQFQKRIKKAKLKRCLIWAIAVFTAFMVLARLISGVHWLSDIIGGVIVSFGLLLMYCYFSKPK